MKNNKNDKIFDFTLLQEYQKYDTETEKLLSYLIIIHPEMTSVITYIKKQNIPATNKIALLTDELEFAFFGEIDGVVLPYFACRIGSYLFCGSEEYKYRKQFAK